jgi:hypothetical protein
MLSQLIIYYFTSRNGFQTAHQHTDFWAHSGIVRMIPRLLGPQSSKASKFPRLLSDGVPLEEVAERASREVDVMMKKVPNLHYAGMRPFSSPSLPFHQDSTDSTTRAKHTNKQSGVRGDERGPAHTECGISRGGHCGGSAQVLGKHQAHPAARHEGPCVRGLHGEQAQARCIWPDDVTHVSESWLAFLLRRSRNQAFSCLL